MMINKSDFVISAVGKKQYPDQGFPEIAFAGRSNVGKSSLINTLINRKNLARTSGRPGKTQTINFYLINDNFHLVDLPGYGFAKVSKSIKEKWSEFIEEYFHDRNELKGIIQLIDVRHPPTVDDVMMFEWLKHLGIPFLLVATKADKISKGQYLKHKKIIREKLMINNEDIQLFSAENKVGKEDILKWIDDHLALEESEKDEF